MTVFNTCPKEAHQSVPSTNGLAAVTESEPQELPSNQEAFRQESQRNIDSQHITRAIQDSVKTALKNLEEHLKCLECNLEHTTTTRYSD